MRLITHRQVDETNQSIESQTVGGSSYVEVEKSPINKTSNSPVSNSSDSLKHHKKIKCLSESSNNSLLSPISSPRKLDRQKCIESSSQNKDSSTSSESYSTQICRPENREMVMDRADTVPSESTPISSSSTPLSSPNLEKNMVNRSTVVDPPSDFADKSNLQTPKDIYFPYLSKVKNLDNDSGTHERLYQPLRFDKPIKDPFALPSKTKELFVTVEPISDSAECSPIPSESPIKSQESIINTPNRMGRSPLLLRHGYIPYRGFEMNDRFRPYRKDREEFQGNIAGLRPTIVKAGCAPPVAEPIIVAEYFVPLCDE
ncbi:hypothetical protein ACTXT7_002884 [Hymenolepis weldensis]